MYSADGYCIDQGASQAIRYGKCSSAQNGCGWIAAYNLLHLAGKPYPPARVRAGLAPTLWMGGRMGTRATALWWYLHRRGVTLIPTLRAGKAAEGPGGRGAIGFSTPYTAKTGCCAPQNNSASSSSSTAWGCSSESPAPACPCRGISEVFWKDRRSSLFNM